MQIYILLRSVNGSPAMPFSAHASEQGANERLALERGEHERSRLAVGETTLLTEEDEAELASLALVGLMPPPAKDFVYFIGPFPLELED